MDDDYVDSQITNNQRILYNSNLIPRNDEKMRTKVHY